MSASIALQKEITIAHLGPVGTYSHQAAYLRFGDSVAYSDQSTISDVFDAVETGAVTYGVVPFEDSTYGSVQQTMDRFLTCHKAQIRAESYLPISHSFLTNSPIGSVKRIYSHPEAFGQCQRWYLLNWFHLEIGLHCT